MRGSQPGFNVHLACSASHKHETLIRSTFRDLEEGLVLRAPSDRLDQHLGAQVGRRRAMNEAHQFHRRMVASLPPGTVMRNLGGGPTTIKSYSAGKVSYVRGKSLFRVAISDPFSAYTRFRGARVRSRDLRLYAPMVFDSSARPAGHSCNCTFLFMVLRRLGMASAVEGQGTRSDPFSTTFL